MCYADDDDCDMAQVVNNTKYELTLNPDEKCGRECNCFGWQVFWDNNHEGNDNDNDDNAGDRRQDS